MPDAAGGYPVFAQPEKDRERWDLCVARASELFEEPPGSETVTGAAIALFKSDIPTHPSTARPG